jgi:hypothetical protein
MHLASIVTIVSIVGMVSAAANPVADADANPIANADAETSVLDALEKRDCKANNCKCKVGTKRGQYCGRCSAVTNLGNGGKLSHVYECNPRGGCCDYGLRTSCDKSSGYKPCGP